MALMCECCSMSVDWWGQTALACRSADLPICRSADLPRRAERAARRTTAPAISTADANGSAVCTMAAIGILACCAHLLGASRVADEARETAPLPISR